ncbi:MAG: tRNA lysidine(34) synthetase TilS [Leptospiraceae bacterium]|nr:tRNA lysidine(34) synthetase TilS [Leptospiraceae bacterium]MDW7976550.1 tRNA lysidine(34) synthetase TilS [Leptospiraceae bacterium]
MNKREFSFYNSRDVWNSFQGDEIEDEVLKNLFLPSKNMTYIISISGGPDSVLAAFFYWHFYQKNWITQPVLFHFNHQLRKEADEEEDFVWNLSREWDLPIYIESRNVREFAQKTKTNLEKAARILRYKSLVRLQNKLASSCLIVTGHNADDYVETLFLRLLRGSSLNHVYFHHQRVLPVRIAKKVFTLKILSPLLLFDKKEILEFLENQKLPYKIDVSNFDVSFKRNFLRHKVISSLKKLQFSSSRLWQITHLNLMFFQEQISLRDFLFLDRVLFFQLSNREVKILLDQITKNLGISPFSHRVISEFILQSYQKRIQIETKECLIQSVKRKLWFFRKTSLYLKPPIIQKEPNHWKVQWHEEERIYPQSYERIEYIKNEKQKRIKDIVSQTLREKEIPLCVRVFIPYGIKKNSSNYSIKIFLSFLDGFWDFEIFL